MQRLLCFLVILLLTSCSYITSYKVAEDFHPLWKYDTLPNGFNAIKQSYYCKFKNGQDTVTVELSPLKYKTINSAPSNLQKKERYKGIDYIIYEAGSAWDALGENGSWVSGLTYEKSISWKNGNFIFGISSSTNMSKENLNFLTTKLASTINLTSIKKMKKDTETVRAEYINEKGAELRIEIKNVEQGNKRIEGLAKDTELEKIEEKGLTFYTFGKPFDYSRSVFCMTKDNFYEFSTGIPSGLQTEELRDEVDFLNMEYAYKIIKEIE